MNSVLDQNPPKMSHRYERRRQDSRHMIQREIWSWFMEGEIRTVQRMVMVFMLTLSISIAMFSKLLLSFPPIWQHGALTPPFWIWPVSLWGGVYWQSKAENRKATSDCTLRNASVFSFFVLAMMVMPLFPRTPMLSCIVFFVALLQGTLAARIWHNCRKVK